MIQFEKHTLSNGLRIILHHDPSTPMVVINTLYDVGARDESPEKTGFAHLFEHLMFGGSVNIPDFDGPLQNAGGESNAFTSNDITNYYNVLPKENLETALWLESDRMLSLAFTTKSLEVQRNVVIEEFKQRYLNQPYGDVWLQLRPLAYTQHPYQWATIGKELAHIEQATMEDVKDFFRKHYHPGNANVCIGGNFDKSEVLRLLEDYFGSIPAGEKVQRSLPFEPKQEEYRSKTIDRKVPADAFYYAFKMPNRTHEFYYTADVLSDAIGREKSSPLYVKLKKELELVTDISAFITGNIDEGLLIISGKLATGKTFEELEDELWKVLSSFLENAIEDEDMMKLLNKIRTSKEFQEQGLLNRAMNLCFFELIGDAGLINEELEQYQKITAFDIQKIGKEILTKENCSLLRVKSQVA